MSEYILEVKNLTKQFGELTALKFVNISVKRGEIYGLVGDNGAGKSTLLKTITGQVFPTSGEVCLFEEHTPTGQERERKRTGALIESAGFFPNLTVMQNLEYYRIQKGVPGRERTVETLKSVNLLYAAKKKCRTLSMGMKQRLGLAIAVIAEPELLILDEPINGLDPSGIIEIRNYLQRLCKEKNVTIILSSHILTELEQLASVFGFLKEGSLLEQITTAELKERCSDYIEISVSDVKQYAVLLEKTYNHTLYRVMPDNTVRITSPDLPIDAYGKLASDNGLSISKLNKKQLTLEQYYINLNKGGNAA